MMAIAPLEKLLTRGHAPEVIHECRRCGTIVDAATAECPTCEVDSIARYEIVSTSTNADCTKH